MVVLSGTHVIRPYAVADREACLGLLRSNMPEHFVPDEERQFAEFLDALPGPYFVMEDERGALLACGGIALEPDDPAAGALCWGIVRNDQQGRGLGKALTVYRLGALPGVKRMRINTSQKVRGFYEKLGFVAKKMTPDGFGPGLDDVLMERA